MFVDLLLTDTIL